MLTGDLKNLDAAQRANYYTAVCKSLGLNPLTQPFAYLTLNGKLRLYALRDCADQLRRLHGISISIANREKLQDVYIVTARAKDRTGREDESTGAVPLGHLRGDALANALMKAETKAKRRVTLSIAGLGWLDETELETIPAPALTPMAGELVVASIHDAGVKEASMADGAAALAQASETPPGAAPAPAMEATDADPKGGVLQAIFARLMAIYPGDATTDPTVIDDRKHLLLAVFNVEVPSGKAGYARLHQLPLDLLQGGLAKLDAMARQAPPDWDPRGQAGADVPTFDPPTGDADLDATATLVAGLKVRAARLGITEAQFADWLDSQQLPVVNGRLRLTVGERERLGASFNMALDAVKQAAAPRQTARRGGKKASAAD